MDPPQAPGDQPQGWLQDDPQPPPAEYRKLMLVNLPEYQGPPNQSWNSQLRRLEMAWAAYRVPLHGTINHCNALLLSLAGQASEMASHLFGEAGQALSYEQVKAECEMLFRPAYKSQTLKQAFKDYRQHLQEPIQAYISTKCALYREAYEHKDLELLIDELNQGIRNANVKRIMMELEFTSVPEYTRKAMFVVILVIKQLKEGVALADAANGLTGSASVQLPQYDDTELMEIGAMAVDLHQMGKVALAVAPKKTNGGFQCQGLGHQARECPSPHQPARESALPGRTTMDGRGTTADTSVATQRRTAKRTGTRWRGGGERRARHQPPASPAPR